MSKRPMYKQIKTWVGSRPGHGDGENNARTRQSGTRRLRGENMTKPRQRATKGTSSARLRQFPVWRSTPKDRFRRWWAKRMRTAMEVKERGPIRRGAGGDHDEIENGGRARARRRTVKKAPGGSGAATMTTRLECKPATRRDKEWVRRSRWRARQTPIPASAANPEPSRRHPSGRKLSRSLEGISSAVVRLSYKHVVETQQPAIRAQLRVAHCVGCL
ncbi:hypothetical protein C8R45DRAFT_923576 [Mycena sanguinolenta]|nr:hypothetical protein C8R45DRAFT_923576 [Mycena sanguinolenta]